MLNSTEHEINSAHKLYNANISWHFYIYKHDNFNIWVFWVGENLYFLAFYILWAAEISYSDELSMKVFITSGLDKIKQLWTYYT